MPVRIGVLRAGEKGVAEMAAASRAALDRALAHPAELWIAVARDTGLLVGAFQRGAGLPPTWPMLRRGSGGPEILAGEGSVHCLLALARPDALEPCDERRIVNRHVRPLLHALAAAGSPAHYFGRDWVSVGHRPAAWVGFAHDAATRRTVFEALVAVRVPFAVAQRASLRDKQATTLEAEAGKKVDAERLVEALARACAERYGAELVDVDAAGAAGSLDDPRGDPRLDPPWAATCEEAIGTLGAGPDARGAFRVGGDLLASRDAVARLEARLEGAADADVGEAVDDALAAPGVALEGVRSLASVRDVILGARRALGLTSGR